MRTQVIVFAALAGLVGACTSGDGGTAAIPFDPFGSESAPATTEPTSGGNEAPPGSGAVSIQDLCEYDCQRFAACPSYGGCDASTCSQLESAFELQDAAAGVPVVHREGPDRMRQLWARDSAMLGGRGRVLELRKRHLLSFVSNRPVIGRD